MKKQLILCLFGLFSLLSCSNKDACATGCAKEKKEQVSTHDTSMEKQEVVAKNADRQISCRLTSAELQKRKETVIASLKRQILEKKELYNGFAYKFAGTDTIVDELAAFVKSERSCCSFFTFGLSFSGDGTEAWLNLTGPDGAKQMIVDEIGL